MTALDTNGSPMGDFLDLLMEFAADEARKHTEAAAKSRRLPNGTDEEVHQPGYGTSPKRRRRTRSAMADLRVALAEVERGGEEHG
jgi:hypothetical protein